MLLFPSSLMNIALANNFKCNRQSGFVLTVLFNSVVLFTVVRYPLHIACLLLEGIFSTKQSNALIELLICITDELLKKKHFCLRELAFP